MSEIASTLVYYIIKESFGCAVVVCVFYFDSHIAIVLVCPLHFHLAFLCHRL